MNTIKNAAQFISWLFHPLLMLTYMIALLMIINPYSFGVNQVGEGRSGLYLIYVFIETSIIPGIFISMLKKLELMPSLDLGDRTSRILPFIATGMLYMWLYANFSRLPDVPIAFESAILGIIIALFTAFMLNIFSKINLHTVGMGSLVGMVMVTILLFNYSSFQFGNTMYSIYGVLFIAIALAGLVGSARIIVENPTPKDLYSGYIVGFASQLIALQFVI